VGEGFWVRADREVDRCEIAAWIIRINSKLKKRDIRVQSEAKNSEDTLIPFQRIGSYRSKILTQ
jgi:hypothetical protein